MTAARRPRDLLLHPMALGALALLVLNDQVLKHAAPGAWTGKLSDVAGLAVFPLVLAALADGVLRRAGHALAPPVLVGGAAVATALVFALVKTVPAATDAFRWSLGALQWPLAALAGHGGGGGVVPVAAVTDPTDLLALPALALGPYLARPRGGRCHICHLWPRRFPHDRAWLTGDGVTYVTSQRDRREFVRIPDRRPDVPHVTPSPVNRSRPLGNCRGQRLHM